MTDSFSPARAAIGAPDDPVDGGDLAPVFGRVRLRTLIFLRWLAVAGQTATVLGVHFGLGFALPLPACFALIAASAALNALLPVSGVRLHPASGPRRRGLWPAGL